MAGAAGAAAPALPQAVHTVEGIKSYELANGLKVVLFADQSKPTATVNTTYLVGSRHENYGETGMAHLLEHLMFKGSKNYPDPTREFTRRGFRMNGTTWLYRKRRQHALGSRLERGRDDQFLHRQKGSRHGNDRGP